MAERKPRVEDYMIREVAYVPVTYTVKQAVDALIASEFHGMPVTEDGRLVGFITAKELLRHYGTPDRPISEIIRKGTVTVIDENGMLLGIVSNLDIVRSHIERATPNKVAMIKNFLEAKHGISIMVRRRIVPVEALRPTQKEVYADELLGRKEEIRRGLVEPIIVIQKNDHYLLVDGHHRALASKQMGVKQFSAFVLEPSRDVELGMERSAEEMGLRTLDDVKIIEGAHHPLVEITTRLLKSEQ